MSTIPRRNVLPWASALLLFSGACGPSKPEGPSLVLVIVDTLRADYLSCYGFEGETSPRLDALAGEGIVFEHCYSQAPWTKPSVATILTSLHPRAHGVLTHHGWFGERDGRKADPHAAGAGSKEPTEPTAVTDVLPARARTLAEILRARGYRTAAFVTNPWIRPEWGFAQGFERFEHYREKDGRLPVADALKWLKENEGTPSFVLVHLMDVHGPYDAPEEDYRALRESPGLQEDWTLDDRSFLRIPEYLRLSPWTRDPAARELATWRARYAAGIRDVDEKIGSLVDRLREEGTLDETVLMVTADHGEELLEHDGWDHGRNLYDHQTRVPWIVRLPGGASAGTRVSEVCSLTDVMPTALSFLGLDGVRGLHGRDRSDLSRAADPFAFSIAEGVKWRPQVFSLRTKDYKLVADLERTRYRLFHLRTDPREQNDVSAREPETVRLLLEELHAHIKRAGEDALSPEQVEISEELQERLDDLGYGG